MSTYPRFPEAEPYNPDDRNAGHSSFVSIPTPQPYFHTTINHDYLGSHPDTPQALQPSDWSRQGNDPSIDSRRHQQMPPHPPQAPPLHSTWSTQPRTASPESYHTDYNNPYTHRTPATGSDSAQATPRPSEPSQSSITGTNAVGCPGEQGQEHRTRELQAEDIGPSDRSVSIITAAIHELETCKTIFEQCDEKFVNDFIIMFPKESLEFKVQHKVEELKVTSTMASSIAQEIHNAQRNFGRSVSKKLKVLVESGGGTLLPDSDLTELWKKVENLSSTIKSQTGSLQSSIIDLSRLVRQAKDKYENKTIRKKLWEWLVRFFEAIATALGIVRHGVLAVIGGVGIIGAAVGANRQSLVAATNTVFKEIKNFNSKQEQGFQHILDFLSAEMPKSIKKAELSLIEYSAVHEFRQADINSRREGLKGNITAEQANRALKIWEAYC